MEPSTEADERLERTGESLTRRRAMIGLAAVGGAGAASALAPAAALAATTEYFVNAVDFGAKGDGATDDTAALQEAIKAAISAKKPLYLPPGRYKTSSELKAETSSFSMFGAGPRVSIIAPTGSTYNALRVGPGTTGSGNVPGGSLRDFGFSDGGSSAERTKAGVEKTTGKAALVLDGWRLAEIDNVIVLEANFDIAFDMIHNCFGTTFRNVRSDFNTCRVGMNIREGSESGSDSTWLNCWFAGEVAAVHIAGNGGGFHFYGGQFSSSNQATVVNDSRASLILGKEYTSATTGGVYNVSLSGIDFEGAQRCWLIRSFAEASWSAYEVAFNGNGGSPNIGVWKATAAADYRPVMINCRLAGTFSNPGTEIVKLEGGFSAQGALELSTSGQFTANGVGFNADEEPLIQLCRISNGSGFVPNGGALGVSREDEVAAASEIKPRVNTTVLKITGTTEIKKIAPTVSGHVLTLRWTSTAKLVKGENLKIPATISPTANDSCIIHCDGTSWYLSSPLQAN